MIRRGAIKRLRDIAEVEEGWLRIESEGYTIDGETGRLVTVNERYDDPDVIQPVIDIGEEGEGVIPHITVDDDSERAWMAVPSDLDVGDFDSEPPDWAYKPDQYLHAGYVTDIAVDVTVPINRRVSLAHREEQVFLYNLREDYGEMREGMNNPADFEWYPTTKSLTRYTGIGEKAARKITHRVEVVEDLLDGENAELAEFVRMAGTSEHDRLLDEVLEDYRESREEREEWEVRFVREAPDWQDKRGEAELESIVPEEMRSYRDAALAEASSLRADSLRRAIYSDAVVRYAADREGVEVGEFVERVEAEDLGELIDEYGMQMFPEDIDVIDVSERTRADVLSTLRYFYDL